MTDTPLRDAAPDVPPDAPTAVRRVDPCPATVAATITTVSSPNYAFMPADITIDVNDIVKLAPENIHNIVPHTMKPSDPGLRSGATGEVRCVQFVQAGTFNYRCSPHPIMEGVIRVQ